MKLLRGYKNFKSVGDKKIKSYKIVGDIGKEDKKIWGWYTWRGYKNKGGYY